MFKFIEAKTVADVADPSNTLGIEITDPDVAALCRLGNIDGQHNTGRSIWPGNDRACPPAWRGRAAIEIAITIRPNSCAYCGGDHPDSRDETGCDMYARLLPEGFTFATSRPDLDSVGAMAIVILRSIGFYGGKIDYDLARTIAERDSFVARPWSPSPLPTVDNPWPRGSSTVDASPETAHLGLICSPRRGDFTESLSLAERVIAICLALVPNRTVDHFSTIAEACGVPDLGDANQQMGRYISILDRAHDAVLSSRKALAACASEPGALTKRDGFVEARAMRAGALSLGYCIAPVVVAFDQSVKGKVTIAAYTDGHLDAAGLTAELNRLEAAAGGSPKWGGPRNMVCSPSHVGTRLSDATISDTISRFVAR